jgi:hypothetical protein
MTSATIMKVELLRLDAANKPSLISESGAKIRINIPCKGKPNNTTYARSLGPYI